MLAWNFPLSGYSQISVSACVEILRYFSGPVPVFVSLCAYSGPPRGAPSRAEHVACLDLVTVRTEPVDAFAFEDHEHLLLHMMHVEGAAGFSGRHFAVDSAELRQAYAPGDAGIGRPVGAAAFEGGEFEFGYAGDGIEFLGHAFVQASFRRFIWSPYRAVQLLRARNAT